MCLKTAIIHQPHFLPWLGYFNKLSNCDIFIVQDNVQFRRRYYQNRTLIQNTQKTPIWFTIPVKANRHTRIQEVIIADMNWQDKLRKTLRHSYSKEKFYKENIDFILDLINSSNDNFLVDLNVNLLNGFSKYLNLIYDIEYSHHYLKHSSATEDLVHICLQNEIKRYVFGEGGGLNYHGTSMFKTNKIKTIQQKFYTKYSNFNEKIYPISNEMSILHSILTIGKEKTEKIIKNTWKIKTANNTV